MTLRCWTRFTLRIHWIPAGLSSIQGWPIAVIRSFENRAGRTKQSARECARLRAMIQNTSWCSTVSRDVLSYFRLLVCRFTVGLAGSTALRSLRLLLFSFALAAHFVVVVVVIVVILIVPASHQAFQVLTPSLDVGLRIFIVVLILIIVLVLIFVVKVSILFLFIILLIAIFFFVWTGLAIVSVGGARFRIGPSLVLAAVCTGLILRRINLLYIISGLLDLFFLPAIPLASSSTSIQTNGLSLADSLRYSRVLCPVARNAITQQQRDSRITHCTDNNASIWC